MSLNRGGNKELKCTIRAVNLGPNSSQVENKQFKIILMHITRWVLNIHFSVNCIGRLNCAHKRSLIHVTFRDHIKPGFTWNKQNNSLFLVHLMCNHIQFDIVWSKYPKDVPSNLLLKSIEMMELSIHNVRTVRLQETNVIMLMKLMDLPFEAETPSNVCHCGLFWSPLRFASAKTIHTVESHISHFEFSWALIIVCQPGGQCSKL